MKLSAPSKQTAVDPVCGMQVDPCKTELTADYEDKRFYFCAEGVLTHLKRTLTNIRTHPLPGKKDSGEDIWTD